MASGIPRFLKKKVCRQTAVYWGNPQNDGYGSYDFDDPVEIACRWDHMTQRITDDAGNEIVSKAEVLVLQDLDEGGMLYLGTLNELDSDTIDNPQEIKDVYPIQQFGKNPLFGSTDEFVRVAYL